MSRFVRRLPSELIPKLFFEMVEELLYISRIVELCASHILKVLAMFYPSN
jgi:hypothetical protein